MENDLRTSLIDMANGGFKEVIDYEVNKVMDNIWDVNTKATAKRKVATTVKTALATVNPVTTTLYIAGEDHTGELRVVEMTPQVPGQVDINGIEQTAAPVLKLIGAAV